MTYGNHPKDTTLSTLARAADGDSSALHEAEERIPNELIDLHRLGPLLATRAAQAGVHGPAVDHWRSRLFEASARRLELRHAVSLIGPVLERHQIPWMPIKGMGLPPRTYESLDTRPTTDLDILIPPENLDPAVRALRSSGWRDVRPAPLSWRFLVEEGYNWQAIGPAPIILELHFRLWGSVPESYVGDVFRRSSAEPDFGSAGRRISPVDAAILAGVHFWQTPGTRPLIFLYDLHRIINECLPDEDVNLLKAVAVRHGLQLFMTLALQRTSQLWQTGRTSDLAEEFARHCSVWERRAIARAADSPRDKVPLGVLSLARLLSGRPSRSGWKAAWRSIWPHPGTLLNRYPQVEGRVRRRMKYALQLAGRPSAAFRRH